jgi:hypothetical protein
MLEKLDLAKQLKQFYTPSAKEAQLVAVPALNYLMIDGQGDPRDNPDYQAAVSCLYQFSYGLKFKIKKAGIVDYAVMPLEGLWWVEDLSLLDMEQRDNWRWTMMIAQPEVVTAALIDEIQAELIAKKGNALAAQVRFEAFGEGLCAQILHVGPYATEMPTVERLHTFAREQNCQLTGKHHEIYLSDPNRSAPEKLRTILRQPVQRL